MRSPSTGDGGVRTSHTLASTARSKKPSVCSQESIRLSIWRRISVSMPQTLSRKGALASKVSSSALLTTTWMCSHLVGVTEGSGEFHPFVQIYVEGGPRHP